MQALERNYTPCQIINYVATAIPVVGEFGIFWHRSSKEDQAFVKTYNATLTSGKLVAVQDVIRAQKINLNTRNQLIASLVKNLLTIAIVTTLVALAIIPPPVGLPVAIAVGVLYLLLSACLICGLFVAQSAMNKSEELLQKGAT